MKNMWTAAMYTNLTQAVIDGEIVKLSLSATKSHNVDDVNISVKGQGSPMFVAELIHTFLNDHPIIRGLIKLYLSDDFDELCAGEASDIINAVDKIMSANPPKGDTTKVEDSITDFLNK